MLLQDNLTNDREKRYNSTRRPKSLMNVLRRPVETAEVKQPFGEPISAVPGRTSALTNSGHSSLLIRVILRGGLRPQAAVADSSGLSIFPLQLLRRKHFFVYIMSV